MTFNTVKEWRPEILRNKDAKPARSNVRNILKFGNKSRKDLLSVRAITRIGLYGDVMRNGNMGAKAGTLYKAPSELFSWLKGSPLPHNTIEQ